MRDDRNSRLPTGYTPDLVGDLCIIVPHNPDGKIVARLHRMVDPEEVSRAAEEGREKMVYDRHSREYVGGVFSAVPIRDV